MYYHNTLPSENQVDTHKGKHLESLLGLLTLINLNRVPNRGSWIKHWLNFEIIIRADYCWTHQAPSLPWFLRLLTLVSSLNLAWKLYTLKYFCLCLMFWSLKKMTRHFKNVNYPCFISRSCRSLAIWLLTGSVSLTPPCVPLGVQLFQATALLWLTGSRKFTRLNCFNIIRCNTNKGT